MIADEAKGILKWADGKAVKSEVDMQVCNCLSVCAHVCVFVYENQCCLWLFLCSSGRQS